VIRFPSIDLTDDLPANAEIVVALGFEGQETANPLGVDVPDLQPGGAAAVLA